MHTVLRATYIQVMDHQITLMRQSEPLQMSTEEPPYEDSFTPLTCALYNFIYSN